MDRGLEGKPISPTARNQELDRGEPESAPAGGARRRPPWAQGGPNAEDGSFGAWLRRQREMREIDLREIAERTKISLRYLQAMEQDRFELLPAPVFARGFLREYAKYVGLSPDEVVNFYLSALGGDEEEEDEEPEELPVRRRAGAASPWSYGVFVVMGLILLAAVVALIAFYWADSRNQESERTSPLPVATPALSSVSEAAVAPAPPPLPPAEPRAPLRVTLDFTQECWVEIVVDGRRQISERHAPGESLQIDAERSVLLTTLGNAPGVEVQVNGEPFPLPPGRVIRDVRIELPTATTGGGAASP